MRFLGELAQARNDGIDIERASTTLQCPTCMHARIVDYTASYYPLKRATRALRDRRRDRLREGKQRLRCLGTKNHNTC